MTQRIKGQFHRAGGSLTQANHTLPPGARTLLAVMCPYELEDQVLVAPPYKVEFASKPEFSDDLLRCDKFISWIMCSIIKSRPL